MSSHVYFNFSFGVVMAGKIYRLSGQTASGHAPGIGPMGRYDRSVIQDDIGQEPIVSLYQPAANKRGPEATGRGARKI
jgi:hypothetical protein